MEKSEREGETERQTKPEATEVRIVERERGGKRLGDWVENGVKLCANGEIRCVTLVLNKKF